MRRTVLAVAPALAALPGSGKANRLTFRPSDRRTHHATAARGEVPEHLLTTRVATRL